MHLRKSSLIPTGKEPALRNIIIEVNQNEIGRLKPHQKHLALITREVTNCIVCCFQDKEGNCSLFHFDARTDFKSLKEEYHRFKKINRSFTVYVVYKEDDALIEHILNLFKAPPFITTRKINAPHGIVFLNHEGLITNLDNKDLIKLTPTFSKTKRSDHPVLNQYDYIEYQHFAGRDELEMYANARLLESLFDERRKAKVIFDDKWQSPAPLTHRPRTTLNTILGYPQVERFHSVVPNFFNALTIEEKQNPGTKAYCAGIGWPALRFLHHRNRAILIISLITFFNEIDISLTLEILELIVDYCFRNPIKSNQTLKITEDFDGPLLSAETINPAPHLPKK